MKRRYLSVVASILLALTALTATGCSAEAGDEGDDEEDVAEIDSELSKAGGVTVVQCNPFFAGRYERYPNKGATTYATARRFAASIAKNHARTSVIGMEEMLTQTDTDTVRGLLEQATGRKWGARFYQVNPGELGAAIFWRSAVFDLVQDFGTLVIDRLDRANGAKNSYGVPFGGLLLRHKNSTRELAVYAGKLAWNGVAKNGRDLSAREIDALRAEEAKTLHAKIAATTAAHPKATRVILTDLNAEPGEPAWDRMRLHYFDGDTRKATRGAKEQLDYIFWDYDSGKKRKDGFFVDPIVSADFGSDHRYVAARIYVRAANE